MQRHRRSCDLDRETCGTLFRLASFAKHYPVTFHDRSQDARFSVDPFPAAGSGKQKPPRVKINEVKETASGGIKARRFLFFIAQLDNNRNGVDIRSRITRRQLAWQFRARSTACINRVDSNRLPLNQYRDHE